MSQIKVCHITDVHRPEDVRIFHKECVSLSENGYDVFLIEPGASYEKKGIKIIGLGNQPLSRAERILKYARSAFQKALELDCDIYHIHDPELLPYAMLLKRKGKKVIYDIHENVIEDIRNKEWMSPKMNHFAANVYELSEKHICKKLDALVTVTPYLYRKYQKFNRETYQITNYPILQQLIESYRESGRIVFAGGISKSWGHEKIIEAIGKTDECKYVLIGKTYSEDYLSHLSTISGWEKVDYRGFLLHEQVYKELCRSSIGIALLQVGSDTNGNEGTLGNTKLFEEMMAGLPIVCSDFHLWKEIIDKYNCGICVNPSDIQQIRDSIEYLLLNPDVAKAMGKNARIAVEEEYNWATQEKILLNLYSKVSSGISSGKKRIPKSE